MILCDEVTNQEVVKNSGTIQTLLLALYQLKTSYKFKEHG